MNPSDVSTTALYTASDQQVNTPAALLTLNDTISGCSTITMTEASTNGAIQNFHPMDNDYKRCFPTLAIPTPQIETLGLKVVPLPEHEKLTGLVKAHITDIVVKTMLDLQSFRSASWIYTPG